MPKRRRPQPRLKPIPLTPFRRASSGVSARVAWVRPPLARRRRRTAAADPADGSLGGRVGEIMGAPPIRVPVAALAVRRVSDPRLPLIPVRPLGAPGARPAPAVLLRVAVLIRPPDIDRVQAPATPRLAPSLPPGPVKIQAGVGRRAVHPVPAIRPAEGSEADVPARRPLPVSRVLLPRARRSAEAPLPVRRAGRSHPSGLPPAPRGGGS